MICHTVPKRLVTVNLSLQTTTVLRRYLENRVVVIYIPSEIEINK